ncbi:MAG: recombination mediator RecR [Gammaproteobacteria bacterium]|nr:recombination mediator RecR [Gammaproteobacteria bacterium]
MVHESEAIEALKKALRRLPGIGPKAAQRIAFHLLSRDRATAKDIARALEHAVACVGHCQVCNNFSETEVCRICASPRRDSGLLCVVESPADLVSLEQSGAFTGAYFVLMGRLSPLEGIGPDQIGIPKLQNLLESGAVREVILATNATVEGEATAHYISEIARQHGLLATRIAYGVPVGGELEYIDRGTLARAFSGRRET